jgi:hypothetical protein
MVAIFTNGDAYIVACSGDYAYCAGGNDFINDFVVVDLSDPANPSIESAMNAGEACGIAANGNTVYIQTDGYGTGLFATGGLVAINAADPSSPVLLTNNNVYHFSSCAVSYFNNYVYSCSFNKIGIYDTSGLMPCCR